MRGDLPGGGPRDRDPLQDYAFLRFSLRKGYSEPGFVVGLTRGGLRHSPRQARHIARPTPQQDFVLVVAVEQLSTSASPAAVAVASGSISISRQEISARSLTIVRVRPQSGSLPRAYAYRRPVRHRHRARRDDCQPRGRRQPRCDQRLHGNQQVETAVPLRRQRV